MGWMHGITLERFWTFKCTVEHDVAVGRLQQSLYLNMYFKQARNLSYKAFQSCLDSLLDRLFLCAR